MATKIIIAGGTGNLGGRIVRELRKRGADVHALVRIGTEPDKLERLKQAGATVIPVDLTNKEQLVQPMHGAACVVSVLQGLGDVIIDTQSVLLDAAVMAGVPRFIPSDFSTDFTQVPAGYNRNFDLRRAFQQRLDAAPIAATSILNGAFADLLMRDLPVLNVSQKMAGYWDRPDWKIDFTTMDDTAAFTAAAALDTDAPRWLRIASFQISPRELAELGKEITGEPFRLTSLGTLDELAAKNARDRAEQPEGEQQIFPRWQQGQYMHSMFISHNETLDNDRYPDLTWISPQALLSQRVNKS